MTEPAFFDQHFVSDACDYDLCATCGMSRFAHSIMGRGAVDCGEEFVLGERCEICKGREKGGGKLFYFTHPSPPRSDFDR